ncbi:MAG TPA: lipocalin-like domain-containing protein [Burkholderiales bacterium]|nr:lipocalin-like domain-containing protein [Burkholderiales bacterium]
MAVLHKAPALWLAALAFFCSPASAADNSVVGTWALQSWVSTDTETGATVDVFGKQPTGYLIYTAGGHMAVVLSADGRAKLSSDRFNSPVDERAKAFSTHVAYVGTYTLTNDGIMHHVKAASFQNWVDTEQFRYVEVKGDTMTIKTPPLQGPPDGKMKVTTLVLKRLD